MSHVIHYIPDTDQDGHVPTSTCVCQPEPHGTGYLHRRRFQFGWTYPCCGKQEEGRVYGGKDGPSTDAMRNYIDALPHDCAVV